MQGIQYDGSLYRGIYEEEFPFGLFFMRIL